MRLVRSFVICSLVLSTAGYMLGCGGQSQNAKPEVHHPGDGHDHGGHDHPSEGPHHGHLIELGNEEYHAELTHDESAKTVTVYLLDNKAAKSVAIDAELPVTVNLVLEGKPRQWKLTAMPQDGDPAGKASAFGLTDEELLEALEAPSTKGRLNVSIDGKSFTGTIEHHAHDDHEHEKAKK